MTFRRLSLLFVAIAAALLAARLALLQGLLTVVRIDGASMAEGLPGEHVEITCSKCSRRWLADLVQWQAVSHVTCPECGHVVDDTDAVFEHPGTRVVIDRAAYLLDRPQRFDVVAFEVDGELAVKRIVALPCEAWEIHRGELLVDGRLARKNYAQFRELATLLSASGKDWQPAEGGSAWRSGDNAWSCQASDAANWLEYRSHAAHPAARDRSSPVQDYDAYNPALARELNEMADVMAECEVAASDATIHCRVHDGYGQLVLRWEIVTGVIVARRDEREIARCGACRLSAGRLVWGVCDQQLFFVLNDQVLLQHELAAASQTFEPTAQPLAIGVSGTGECRVHNLRVLRDIYYLDAQGSAGQWRSPQLAVGEYGVLGDNPPLSIDSRHWERGVRARDLLGKVFAR